MSKCSVVIIANNVQHTIEQCIQSAMQITDDVVVVDSGSKDQTAEIAKKLGANVIFKAWEGFSANKNFGNAQAKNDFIFWLDSDEVIPKPLADEIISYLDNIDPHTCLSIKRQNYFNDKPIRFGAWQNDVQIRLFNRNYIKWDETKSVHETLIVSNVKHVILLKNKLHHYTTKSFDEYVAKMKKYASQYRINKPNGNLIKMIFSPFARLIGEFIFKAGFIDGVAGLKIALAHAYYVYLKYKF